MSDSTSLPTVTQDNDGQLTTTSLIVAEGVGLQHKNVRELIEDNIADFEEFGVCRFETAKPSTSANGGGRPQKLAVLNRDQALLLMTYLRNSAVVRDFKKRLIRAFTRPSSLRPGPREGVRASADPWGRPACRLCDRTRVLTQSGVVLASLMSNVLGWLNGRHSSVGLPPRLRDKDEYLALKKRAYEMGYHSRSATKKAIDGGYLVEVPVGTYTVESLVWGKPDREVEYDRVPMVTEKGLEMLFETDERLDD